ncbi:hypothetical protein C7Q86_14500 [Staphylococcus aureus]|nr:hypothetical protein C7Q86_14500 [Staphylococcus aureus]
MGHVKVLLGMFLSLKTLYRKRTVIWPFYFYTIIRTLSKYLEKTFSYIFINKKLITSYANLVLLMIKSLNYSYRKTYFAISFLLINQ